MRYLTFALGKGRLAQKTMELFEKIGITCEEMKDPSSRPELADENADIASYDVIFLGFPIWWYVAPTIINTFLEAYDFSGKTIILFATSGGSGVGKTVEKLKPSVSDTTVIKEGKLLNGQVTKENLENWLKTFNL